MRTLLRLSRYSVVLAVLSLVAGAVGVLVFGVITTATMIHEAFGLGMYNAEGARLFALELIELVDLFLLGTILLVTAIGLYELFIDPAIPLPAWLSVANLEQLKANLVAVVIVMLAILFLGAVAGPRGGEASILGLGTGIGLALLGLAAVVLVFQRVEQAKAEREPTAAERPGGGDRPPEIERR